MGPTIAHLPALAFILGICTLSQDISEAQRMFPGTVITILTEGPTVNYVKMVSLLKAASPTYFRGKNDLQPPSLVLPW